MTLARIAPEPPPRRRPSGAVDIDADREVVERIQQGDAAAFDGLYRQYFARLRAFCLRRVGDPHDAEEIAQEAFAKAFAALGTLSGERRFYPWLTVIASRLCIDHHRRSGRTELSADLGDDAVDGGQEQVLAQLDAALVRSALRRLPARQQEVLRLREDEGWSYHRIAEHHGLSVGAVESLLVRARRRLRQEFVTLSGGERGLAAIPVIGVSWQRAQRALRRLGSVGWPADSVAVAAHALTAVAVTAALALPVATGARAVAPSDSGARPASLATTVDEARAQRPRPSGGVEAAAGVTPTASAPALGQQPGGGSGVRIEPPVTTSTEDGRAGSENTVDVGPAWLGHSPGQIAEDVDEDRAAVVGWIERNTP